MKIFDELEIRTAKYQFKLGTMFIFYDTMQKSQELFLLFDWLLLIL